MDGIFILIGLTFFVCAVTGFFTIVYWMLRLLNVVGNGKTAKEDRESLPTMGGAAAGGSASSADPVATFCSQLDWLFNAGLIHELTYRETRQALIAKFGRRRLLPPEIIKPEIEFQEKDLEASVDDALIVQEELTGAVDREGSGSDPSGFRQGSEQELPPVSAGTHVPVPAFAPTLSPPKRPAQESAAAREEIEGAATLAADGAGPVAWEQVDPPVKPRVPWRELLKSFMEERNIRWGELASGILIVGSAIGLVLSLRRELSNTIPYFPALLFMLFSLAIFGAGAYTLKQWKLRSTSRGLLFMGLLVVPLNFLAAVLLSASPDQLRTISDPLLWMALAVGVTVFGWMGWRSSQLLFRHGAVLPTVATLGSGLSIVAANRGLSLFSTDWRVWLAVPLAGLGSGLFLALESFIARRRAMTPRTLSRIWLMSGLLLFSMLTGFAFFLLREHATSGAAADVAAPAGVVAIAAMLMGSRLFRRTGATGLRFHRLSAAALLSLLAVGLLILAATAATAVRPFAAFGLATGVASLAAALWQKRRWLLPVGIALLTLALIVTINVRMGRAAWSDSLDFTTWKQLLINGQAALCWLAGGLLSVCAVPLVRSWERSDGTLSDEARVSPTPMAQNTADIISENAGDRKGTRQMLSAAAFVLVGSATGLAAARLNPASLFDTSVGTGLMVCFALLMLGTALSMRLNAGLRSILERFGSRTGEGDESRTADQPASPARSVEAWGAVLPAASAVALAAAAGEAAFWNPFLFNWLGWWPSALASRGLLMLTTVAVVLSGMALIARRQRGVNTFVGRGDRGWNDWRLGSFGVCASSAALAGFVCAAVALGIPATVPTAIAAGLLFMAAGGVSVAWRERAGWLLELSSWLVLLVLGALWLRGDADWSKLLSQNGLLFLIQLTAIWSLLWTAIRRLPFGQAAFRQIVDARFGGWQWVELVGISVAGLLLLVTLGSYCPGVIREVVQPWVEEMKLAWQGPTEPARFLLSIAMWAAAMGAIFLHYGRLTQAQMFLLLLSGMAVACVGWWSFDVAIASALRWVLALSGLGVSLLFWLPKQTVDQWGVRVGLLPAGWHSAELRYQAALASLVFTVGLGLAVALLAVSGFMMLGKDALGGPRGLSWLGTLRRDVSYGFPIGFVLMTCLSYGLNLRRPGFVWTGSAVLQLIVVVQLVLLFLSPHPKLATEWFVGIVQSVSIAMTVYGLTWYGNRFQIQPVLAHDGETEPELVSPGTQPNVTVGAIKLHALVNGGLVLGLVGLLLVRYWLFPDVSAGWIQSAASPLGVAAAVALAGFLWVLFVRGRTVELAWPLTAGLLTAVVFAAANVDRFQAAATWWPFRVLVWGFVVAQFLQALWEWRSRSKGSPRSGHPLERMAPQLLMSGLATVFSIRGMEINSAMYPEFAVALLSTTAAMLLGGCLNRSVLAGWLSAALVLIQSCQLWRHDPLNWFLGRPVACAHFTVVCLAGLAILWVASELYFRAKHRERPGRLYSWLPSIIALVGSGWLLACPVTSEFARFWFGPVEPGIWGRWGWAATSCLLALLVISWWNDRARFSVVARCLFTLSIPALLLSHIPESTDRTVAIWLLLVSGVVGLWSFRLQQAPVISKLARQWRIPRVAAGLQQSRRQLSIGSAGVGLLLVFGGLLCVVFSDDRINRFLGAFAVVALAAGQIVLTNANREAGRRLPAIGLLVLGAILVSWSGLESADRTSLAAWARAFVVLGGFTFLLGLVGNRWLRDRDWWLDAIRRSAVGLAVGAVVCLIGVVVLELDLATVFPVRPLAQPDFVAVFLTALALAAGLVLVAVASRLDPLALPEARRQGYVYAAQLVLVLAGTHAVRTMPWLLQLGLQDYWPYLAMLVAFGGIGLSELLRRRELRVLSEPLANSMSVLPVMAAAASLAVSSKADHALTMLLAGLVGCATSILRKSYWSGVAAVVFGNLALWIYYGRWPGLEFLAHPQLWLIPPALSVLAVAELGRRSFSGRERQIVRYLALATIYLSSTSEIFIQGLGDQLWPPMILAVLAVLGMLGGMLLKSRVVIGLGVLFLLLAMTAMVAHAQRKIGHVWPWWAFGVTLGILVLAMFGYFERRRNLLKQRESTDES